MSRTTRTLSAWQRALTWRPVLRRDATRRRVGRSAGLNVGRRGSALLQATISIMVLGAMTSLSVDVGSFFVARTELQRAADAGALAGAAQLQLGNTSALAVQQATYYAQANAVAGQTLGDSAVLVTLGVRTNGVFVAGGAPATAVQVRLKRTSATGNPVRLFFGSFVGLDSIDVQAVSVADVHSYTPTYNFVGIDHASFSSLGVLARVDGRLVSNGDVSVGRPLGVFVGVLGDARSYAGLTRVGTLASVAGSTAKLHDALSYPSVAAPASNDNARIAAYLDGQNNFNVVVTATIPAGTYVVHDLNLIAGVNVTLAGPVTFYVSGAFNLGVAVNLLGSTSFSAEQFKVRVLAGGTVNFIASIVLPVNLDLYAPDSAITIAVGINAYNGRLVGRTLDIALPVLGTFTEDQTLGDPLFNGRPFALVRWLI